MFLSVFVPYVRELQLDTNFVPLPGFSRTQGTIQRRGARIQSQFSARVVPSGWHETDPNETQRAATAKTDMELG